MSMCWYVEHVKYLIVSIAPSLCTSFGSFRLPSTLPYPPLCQPTPHPSFRPFDRHFFSPRSSFPFDWNCFFLKFVEWNEFLEKVDWSGRFNWLENQRNSIIEGRDYSRSRNCRDKLVGNKSRHVNLDDVASPALLCWSLSGGSRHQSGFRWRKSRPFLLIAFMWTQYFSFVWSVGRSVVGFAPSSLTHSFFRLLKNRTSRQCEILLYKTVLFIYYLLSIVWFVCGRVFGVSQ